MLSESLCYAQGRLSSKLAKIDLGSLGISEYQQRYLSSYFRNLDGILQVYGRILLLATEEIQYPLRDFVLVDYGGGSGLLSFLALEAGIGTVIYNDIYDVSCEDARKLGQALHLPLSRIVCGDVDELVSYLRKEKINVNAIVSYDVIEHIYDIKHHFETLGSLPRTFVVVYASSANSKNPLIVRRLRKKQIEAEYITRERTWGHKERDTLEAYFAVRKKIIAAYAPELSPAEIEHLARATRGLRQGDIEKCVDEYRQRGTISYQIADPTNTCDPYTGNWCEHLIDFGWLERTVRNAGFCQVKMFAGLHLLSGSSLKQVLKITSNLVIKLVGNRAIFAAPYYILYAEKPLDRGPLERL